MKPLGLAGIAIFVTICLGVAFECLVMSAMAPIGEGADEGEHVDQALHWVVEKRLPDLAAEDVGQAQHPPLAYVLQALIYGAARNSFDGPHDLDAPGLDIRGRRTLLRPRHRLADDGIDVAGKSARVQLRISSPDGVFLVMRGFSILLGLATALFLLLAAREVFPESPALALATTAFLMLLPAWAAQFSFISSDPLLTLLTTITIWLVLRARRRERLADLMALLGIAIVLGLAFLTKLHAIGAALFVGLVILGDRRSNRRLGGRLRALAIVASGPLLIAGWWYLFRIRETGGLLALDHHAAMKPWLLRLQELQPSGYFDILYELLYSFFGVVMATNIAAPVFFFVLPMSLSVIAIIGAVWPAARAGRSRSSRVVRPRRAESDLPAPVEQTLELETMGSEVNPPPLAPALLSMAFLLVAILVANSHYHHIHGRYFFAILPLLALILGRGLERIAGPRTPALLALGAVWNLVFLLFTVHLSVAGATTVPTEKLSRGKVLEYRDCGHRFFDDRSAGGYEALRQYPYIRLARHSIRTTADDGLRYRFKIADTSRPLQVRVLYPDASFRGQGELPIETAISLFADDVLLHGAQSIGLDRGEQICPLPPEILADGEVVLRWENHAPRGFGVTVAEIWIEEAWVQIEDIDLHEARRSLSFILANIDQEAAAPALEFAVLDRDGPVSATSGLPGGSSVLAAGALAAGEKKPIHLDLGRDVDAASLAVVLRPASRAPLVDLKLAYVRTATAKRSGRAALHDLETLRLDHDSLPGPLAEYDFGSLPAGRFDLSISCATEGGEADCELGLELEGATLDSPFTLAASPDFTAAKRPLDRPDAAPALRLRLNLIRAPKAPIHLNRLRLDFRTDDLSWGFRFPLHP